MVGPPVSAEISSCPAAQKLSAVRSFEINTGKLARDVGLRANWLGSTDARGKSRRQALQKRLKRAQQVLDSIHQ
jgi:hypothetical protein